MTMRLLQILSVAIVVFLSVVDARGGIFSAGRDIQQKTDSNFRITAGAINEIEGMVEETTRKVYEIEGNFEAANSGETYTQDDFGMKGPYPTLGFSLENKWKYFTFQLDMLGFKAEVNTVAHRNYYIGVGDEVQYGGRGYTNMKIPEGTPFSMDILGGITELRGLITPFTFSPDPNFKFTPWIDVGLMLFAGQYDIDAGEPTGTTQYMYPPEDFVIGGKSSGLLGMGLPQYGLGGEIRIFLEKGIDLVFQGDYSICNYSGSSSFLTTSSEREKNLDIDHKNTRVRASLEFPLKSERFLTVGVQYQLIDTEGNITTTDVTPEEILANRDRFDKYAKFKLSSVVGMIGLTF
jgi:hypothetical protein